ncbi:hypothetical protein PFISCL1PPCAC_13854, partial [Pristionchus fissidentatus]
VVPAGSRAAAISLSRLVTGVVTIPSAQFVGFISDLLHGDSELAEDQFHAYRLGLLSSAAFLIASGTGYWALAWFYPTDFARARDSDS